MKTTQWLGAGVLACGCALGLWIAVISDARPVAADYPTTASVQQVQYEPPQRAAGGCGGPGGWGRGPGGDPAQMQEHMLTRLLDNAGLKGEERVAAKQALDAKEKAERTLAEEFAQLRRTADKRDASDAEVAEALNEYRSAMAQYRKTVSAQDQTLVQKLSPRSEARCLAVGILDNGMGAMKPGPMGRAGGMRGPARRGAPPELDWR